MQEPLVPVTGVARGGLGTATNLDDTQVYSLAELQGPAIGPELERAYEPEPAYEPAPALAPPVVVQRTRSATVARTGLTPAGRRVGPIVLVALTVVGIAAALTLRGAPASDPDVLGGGLAGPGATATFPPLATAAPEPTAGPEAGGGGKDKGKGNGKGNGGGNGNN